MLQGDTLKMLPIKKTSLITTPVVQRLQAIELAISSYLSDGYVISYGPASGLIDLSSLAPGKYLVVWQYGTPPTGTLEITTAGTLTGTGSAAHTRVVIMGVVLTTAGDISDNTIDLAVNIATGVDAEKLRFNFCNIDFAASTTNTVTNLNIANSNIEDIGDNFSLLELSGCVFNADGAAAKIRVQAGANADNFCNNEFYDRAAYQIYTINTTPWQPRNWLFSMADTSHTVTFYTPSGTPVAQTLTNFGFRNCALNFGTLLFDSQFGEIPVYTENVVFVSRANFLVAPLTDDMVFNDIESYALNLDLLDFDDFEELRGDWTTEYITSDDSFYAQSTRTYYSIQFKDYIQVPDELKKFGVGYYFVVQREDIEADLIGEMIEKLVLSVDYENDENFLIRAVDSSENVVYFVWIDNTIYPTVFSDFFDGRTYTIDRCFQIFEVESKSGLSNVVRAPASAKAATDSPLQGTVRFNVLDNEIVWRA